jgi:glucose-1-phosphate cytidylyltransferase
MFTGTICANRAPGELDRSLQSYRGAVGTPSATLLLALDGDRVIEYSEKPQADAGWINGGFFVFERAVLDHLTGDSCVLERDPLERLAREGQLKAYRHEGFWEPMDTQRDVDDLNRRWAEGAAPWKVWDD